VRARTRSSAISSISGPAIGFDAAALWRPWAPNLHHQTVGHGHFMAEEAPAEIARALRALLAR
jgi:haloacetate dehalogenase